MKLFLIIFFWIISASATVLQVTSLNTIIKSNQRPKIVELFSLTCSTCKLYGPIFERVEKRLFDQIDFYKIDVDQVNTYNQFITAIPALMFISYDQNGKEQLAFIQGPPLNEESNIRTLRRYFKLKE